MDNSTIWFKVAFDIAAMIYTIYRLLSFFAEKAYFWSSILIVAALIFYELLKVQVRQLTEKS